MKKGFTLIELLVVVLIIGILAAVALPQYQKAVTKARFSEVFANLKSIYQANMSCLLEKGDACNIADLAVFPGTIPASCVFGSYDGKCMASETAHFFYMTTYGASGDKKMVGA